MSTSIDGKYLGINSVPMTGWLVDWLVALEGIGTGSTGIVYGSRVWVNLPIMSNHSRRAFIVNARPAFTSTLFNRHLHLVGCAVLYWWGGGEL